MNKRWIACWLLLVLLVAAGIAGAEGSNGTKGSEADSAVPALMTVYLRGGENRTPVGTAVPLSEIALVSSSLVLPKEGETLEISDGVHTWVPDHLVMDRTGMLTILLMNDTPDPAFLASCPLVPLNVTVMAADCAVISAGADGNRTERRILDGASLIWQDYSCMLVRLSGEAAVGSPVMTSGGELAGLILAEYAEGMHRYMMLTVDGMVQMLAEVSRQADFPGEGAPEGFVVSMEANRAVISWKDAEVPRGDGMNAYVVIGDVENSYLTYFPADKELKEVRLLLTPGRTYLAGFVLSAGTPGSLPEEHAVIALPEAEPLTANGFRSVLCALTEDPAKDAEAGRRPEPLTRITEEQLRSGEVFFYSASSYRVEEKQQETLLVTLTGPDGNNYRYESGWVYGPEYQDDDVWYFALKDSGLLDLLEPGSSLKGTYQMAFYVGGALADRFNFEVE